MKNLKIKEIMSISFFEYLGRRTTHKAKLVVSLNVQKGVVSSIFSCMDLYPILGITHLETAFVSRLHFLFEWLLII